MNMQAAPQSDQNDVRAEIAALKDQKGLLSRQVGEAKKAGEPCDGLISELQQVSSRLKACQKSLKKSLNALDNADSPGPVLPDIPEAVLSKTGVATSVVDALAVPDVVDAARKYVQAHAAASIWHLPEVLEFISAHYGHSCQYFCARDKAGKVVGVLPVVQLRSRLFGNFMVSVPYFNYGGVLADNPDIARTLLEAADAWRSDKEASHVELRHHADQGLQLPSRTGKVTFWLPLPDNTNDLWRSFQPKVRAQVKRGRQAVAEPVIGGAELLDDFYRVFARNMRDLGTPVYDKAFFRELLNTLGPKARLVTVKIGNKPVGCALITLFRGRMEIPWASTLREFNHTGLNMAMYWQILECAIKQGCQVFDFGRCSREAGTYRFKQQWGATPIPLHWDYCLAEGQQLPELNPDNPKFRLMIEAWKRLPLWMSRLIGPGIVKNLP